MNVSSDRPDVDEADDGDRVAKVVWSSAAVLMLVTAVLTYRWATQPTGSSCEDSRSDMVRAASAGDVDRVRAFVEEGHVGPQARDDTGHDPLACALFFQRIEVVRYLLNAGADANAEPGGSSSDMPHTFLQIAVVRGNADQVEALLAAGARPNVVEHDMTALGLALQRADARSTEVLLDHGADAKLNVGGRSTIEIATRTPRTTAQTVAMLLDRGASATEPYLVNFNCWDLSTDLGAILTASPASGSVTGPCRGPIASAAHIGANDVVRLLVSRGANPTDGLYSASLGGHAATVGVLLELGANPNGSPGTTTPLVLNVLFGHRDAAALLLDHGGDPNLGGPAKASTMQFGAAALPILTPGTTNPNLAAAVCAFKGAATNMPPLVLAVALSNRDLADLLLSHGADPNRAADFDPPATPESIALAIGDGQMAQLLDNRGGTRPETTPTLVLYRGGIPC